MDEIWKDIKGYEGYYQASNLGRIRSLDRYIYTVKDRKMFKKSIILTPYIRKDGVVTIVLAKDRIKTTYVLSRIIYGAFNCDFQHNNYRIMIGHKDGDMTNNKLSNLYETVRVIDPNLNRNADNLKRPIICITTNIQFNSLTEASRYYDVAKGNICHCCKGKLKSAGALENQTPLVWMYLDDYNEITKKEIECKLNKDNSIKNRKPKQIICITTGKKFNTIVEASEFYNIKLGSISRCCNGKGRYAGKLEDGTKLVWMFLEDYDKASKEVIESKINDANKTINFLKLRRKVICVTTNEIFESIAEANRYYNISKGKISNVCSGKKKSTGKLEDGTKLIWKYLDD